MKIGLIAMSAKPYHVGHDQLIRLASNETDKVVVFVSLSDRARTGEIVILGSDMKHVWKTLIEPTLPDNVSIEYVHIPVRSVWEFLGKAEEEHSFDSYAIYSDPADLSSRFVKSTFLKYTPELYTNGQIELHPVHRTDNVNISGTMMRKFIKSYDKESFLQYVPSLIDGDEYWRIITTSKTS